MRTYNKEFKINAVNLYKSSWHSLKTIVEALGLAISTLSHWVQDYKKDGDQSFPGKGQVKPHEEELKVLRKELMHVRQERDILKSSRHFFRIPRERSIHEEP